MSYSLQRTPFSRADCGLIPKKVPYTACKIMSSFLIALLLTLLPWPQGWQLLMPQWVVLCLIYWVMSAPGYLNQGVAWGIGLYVDLLLSWPLGLHALSFVVITYMLRVYYLRFRTFPIIQQSFSVMLLLLIPIAVDFCYSRWVVPGGHQVSVAWFGILSSGLLWWVVMTTGLAEKSKNF